MRSIKEQREMTIHIEHAELLDWVDRARAYLQGLLEHMEDEMVIPWEGVTEDDLRTLIEELPED